MPLLTPQDLITFSLKAIGVLGVGQTALAEDYTDAFSALNGMIAGWNVKRWLVYHLVDIPLMATGARSYTIGPGGDFNVPNPTRLEAAYVRQFVQSPQNAVDWPLDILQSYEDYAKISLKGLTTWPSYVFYDSAWPTGKIYVWPIPPSGQFEIHLVLKATLNQFNSYIQDINLPYEYTEALWTNLAIRLASIYPGSNLPDTTLGLAKASLETIRVSNTQIPRLVMPAGLTNPYGFFPVFYGYGGGGAAGTQPPIPVPPIVGPGFINNNGVLCLTEGGGWPTVSPVGPGVWSNGLVASVGPNSNPDPSATPLYFGFITPPQLLALGGMDLPWTSPPMGSGILWNPGGIDGGDIWIA